jgi:hypothetical protein
MVTITRDIPVEELVEEYPAAIRFLAERHILCVVCGDVYWGTLGELMAQKDIPDPDGVVAELNAFLAQHRAHGQR